MNIPATELHNYSAPWNETDVKRCDYCDSEIHHAYYTYCNQSCEDNHISDLSYAITNLLDNIDWNNERFLNITQMLYNKAKELELTDVMQEIADQAKENNLTLTK